MNLPQDFLEDMQQLLQEEFDDFLASYGEVPKSALRINSSKLDSEEASRIFPWDLSKVPWISNGYYYGGEDVPSRHPYYFAGLYYIQEPSAMTPASLLPVRPGDKVLDMCAAPGGKATELGVKLQGKGVLFANDISNSRAKALLKNLELFGIPNLFVTSEEPSAFLKCCRGYFDKILIDAPCSGEGMFRKDPKMIKSFQEHGPEYYARIQKELILTAADLLAPGGMLLYSTCTFSPLENEAVIQHLLDEREDFSLLPVSSEYEGFSEGRPDWISDGDPSLIRCVRIWPHKMKGEGHFAALLQKKGTPEDRKKERPQKEKAATKAPKLSEDAQQFLKSVKLPLEHGTMMEKDGRLYLLPEGTSVFPGIRYLRTGLYLGDIIKGKFFEPSQALAMALRREDFASSLSLPAGDIRTIKYLKGETIDIGDLAASGKGWQLVCADRWPLGWGKRMNDTLKNKYYSGWRWQ